MDAGKPYLIILDIVMPVMDGMEYPATSVRAYDRLKPYGEEESLQQVHPPRNWALNQISSRANYFLGLDHHEQKCQEASPATLFPRVERSC